MTLIRHIKTPIREARNWARSFLFRCINSGKDRFQCPVCGYNGPFKDLNPPTGLRRHAQCPKCGALERHRLQYLVLENLLKEIDPSSLSMLHFAPEPFFRNYLSARFGQYETADLNMIEVGHHVDLQELPFADQSYDFLFASHVLEHIADDKKALSEIRRILKPNGIAVPPVPLVADTTIEYPEPNAYESYHVRAPGMDYFDRYEPFFSRIVRFSSDTLPETHQLYVYEDRNQWPTKECPLRPPMQGEKHIDVVPVCYV